MSNTHKIVIQLKQLRENGKLHAAKKVQKSKGRTNSSQRSNDIESHLRKLLESHKESRTPER